MLDSVLKRIHIVASKLSGNDFIRHTGWNDVFHETFKYYGREKKAISKNMQVSVRDGMAGVNIEGRMVYWPAGADPGRLVDMYFEVFSENNNHYFDIPGMELRAGDVVMDCGACEGYFTRKAIEQGAAKVFCIEPGSVMNQCLGRTFRDEITSGTVQLAPLLIGDRNARVQFLEQSADPTVGYAGGVPAQSRPGDGSSLIEMMTIDGFCERNGVARLDFVKADVEGSEVGLIAGATKTLRKFKPALAIAVYHQPENANRIVEFIEGLDAGYRIRVKGIVVFDGIPRPVMVHCFQERS